MNLILRMTVLLSAACILVGELPDVAVAASASNLPAMTPPGLESAATTLPSSPTVRPTAPGLLPPPVIARPAPPKEPPLLPRVSPALGPHDLALLGAIPYPSGKKIAVFDARRLSVIDIATGLPLRWTDLDKIESVALTPDGRKLLVGQAGGLAIIDEATLAVERIITDAADAIRVAPFADSKRVAVLSAGREAAVFDIASGQRLTSVPFDAPITAMQVMSDGRRIALGGDGGAIRVLDAASGKVMMDILPEVGQPQIAAFSLDGRFAVLAERRGSESPEAPTAFVRRLDPRAKPEPFVLELADKTPAPAPSAPFIQGPGGEVLAFEGGGLRVWDLARLRPGRALNLPDQTITAAAFARDGRRVATASPSGLVAIWDLTTDAPPRTLRPTLRRFGPTALSADGLYLASAASDRPEVLIWNLATGRPILMKAETGAPVVGVGYVGPLRRFYALGRNGTLVLADAATGDVIMKTETGIGEAVRAVVCPQGRSIAVLTRDERLILLDAATGTEVPLDAGPTPIRALGFSADGRTLAAASPKEVGFWNIETHRLAWTVESKPGVETIAFSATEPLTLVAGGQGRFWRLSVANGTPSGAIALPRLAELIDLPGEGLHATTLSDGRRLAKWDLDGRVQKTFEGQAFGSGAPVVSADGRRLATVDPSGVVTVYDRASLAPIVSFASSPPKSPDGIGEWATVTPEGFFAASRKGGELFALVRGDTPVRLDRFTSRMLRPELVRAKLAGDVDGAVKRAAAGLELDKLFAAATGIFDGEQ